MSKLFIVTGTSRGLGSGFVSVLNNLSHDFVCVSRSKTNIETAKCLAKSYEFDLRNYEQTSSLFEKINMDFDVSSYEEIILINNAGVLEPIVSIKDTDQQEFLKNLEINILGTIALTNSFLKFIGDKSKQVITISSGAGKNCYSGWGAYCTSKAALDMYMRCLNEEFLHDPNSFFFSISPGVISTNMQDTIRKQSKENFPMIDKFIALHAEGKLQDPVEVAKKIIDFALLPSKNDNCLLTITDL